LLSLSKRKFAVRLRKEVDGRFVYISRELNQPKTLGPPVLCDLGNAVDGQVEHTEDMQPDVYRSPEMILGIKWGYKIDIWNVGCMVSLFFQGAHTLGGDIFWKLMNHSRSGIFAREDICFRAKTRSIIHTEGVHFFAR
jgi:hypothetical protein